MNKSKFYKDITSLYHFILFIITNQLDDIFL